MSAKSVERMRITYHPVQKKMSFERTENGDWQNYVKVAPISVMVNYMGREIILQNLGTQFFEDILHAMDEIEQIYIDFRGPKSDYEDLKQMIKSFKPSGGREILPGELAELPSVRELFEDIKLYSMQTMEAFLKQSQSFEYSEHNKKIAEDLSDWVKQLEKKLSGLEKDEINLCFVGGYNSGKSTLINALIGEPILKMANEPATAKMFKINQIKQDDDIQVEFPVKSSLGKKERFIIKWIENRLHIVAGPVGNDMRKGIEKTLDKHKGAYRHDQLYAILDFLNSQPSGLPELNEGTAATQKEIWYIDDIVQVDYPLTLNGDVGFHIYDTPGTDSNDIAHLKTLQEALRDPTSSILIYVNDAKKMEGAANQILLNVLNTINASQGSSTIDLGRSFFVLNQADSVTSPEGLERRKSDHIKLNPKTDNDSAKDKSQDDQDNEDVEITDIDLSEKRLFFTDAYDALAAQRVSRGIATQKIREDLEDNAKLINRPWRHLYLYDKMAYAEMDTERVKAEAEAELQEALKEDSRSPRAFYVCSGVYSLQREIETYADKFALAVRAKGMIDGVSGLIKKVRSKCITKEKLMQEKIDDLDRQIEVAQNQVRRDIEEFCREKRGDEPMDNAVAEELHLDIEYTKKLVDAMLKIAKEKIIDLDFFGNDRTKQSIQEVNSILHGKLSDFFGHYSIYRGKVIGRYQKELTIQIQNSIKAMEELSPEVRRTLTDIPDIPIDRRQSDPSSMIDVENYFSSFLFGLITMFDKEKYCKQLIEAYKAVLAKSSTAFKEDYRTTLNVQINKVKKAFYDRIDDLASEVVRLREDKTSFEQELAELRVLLKDAETRENELMRKINGEELL